MTDEVSSLTCGDRVWCQAELLPWDEKAFGFPVGRLLLSSTPPSEAELPAARAALIAWTCKQHVALVATTVPANALHWMMMAPQLGFTCIDLALTVHLARLGQHPRTIRPAALRVPTRDEHEAIRTIAGNAFDFGRYHRDPRFPRALADRRFARWVERALVDPTPGQRFLVAGPLGSPSGFMFFSVRGNHADWHLSAVARDRPSIPGPMLFSGMLQALAQEGVQQISSKISAANTAVLNIYAALGFRFLDPEYTFHWVPPGSRLETTVP